MWNNQFKRVSTLNLLVWIPGICKEKQIDRLQREASVAVAVFPWHLTRDIQTQVQERYGVVASPQLISNVTDAVMEGLHSRQRHALSC